jgi:hypothetical protein
MEMEPQALHSTEQTLNAPFQNELSQVSALHFQLLSLTDVIIGYT